MLLEEIKNTKINEMADNYMMAIVAEQAVDGSARPEIVESILKMVCCQARPDAH